MIHYYLIDSQAGLKKTTAANYNWLLLEDATAEERKDVITRYHLPDDIFIGGDYAEEVSRLENLHETKLKNAYSLALTNLSADRQARIEDRLEPLIFIIADDLLITYTCTHSNFIQHLLAQKQQTFRCYEEIVAQAILMSYTHYIAELKALKQTIDHLDQAARDTAENDELFMLADTERKIVYLDHTLQGQQETLASLWQHDGFREKLANEKLLYDIKLRQKHADKLIALYRDLLETIGGLFTDMMDNNLNHLMKYLDSAALIISVPSLIAGIWGMNTGGLPGKSMGLGFIAVIVLSIVLTVLMAIHLKKRVYNIWC